MIDLQFGDALESLKIMTGNSVDSIVTDPPAGISFMGKSWDSDKGGRDQWIAWLTEVMSEASRVLKPGGHALVWALPRTSGWTQRALEDAGFEIRDVVTHIFGSGFPKSHNIGKSTGDPQFEGFGTALKPATEHWILCRKPLSEKTVAKNVLKHGTGGINIDVSRVGVSGSDPNHRSIASKKTLGTTFGSKDEIKSVNTGVSQLSAQGRFPSNLIVDESAVEELNGQSGMSAPKAARTGKRGGTNPAHMSREKGDNAHQVSEGRWPEDLGGGVSRFFYVAKASKRDKNAGLDGMPVKQTLGGGGLTSCGDKFGSIKAAAQNHHPTVKSTALMSYLIKLITPPGGTVLDPFMGSGSTGVAALKCGFHFVGIEKDQEYYEIATKRVENQALSK